MRQFQNVHLHWVLRFRQEISNCIRGKKACSAGLKRATRHPANKLENTGGGGRPHMTSCTPENPKNLGASIRPGAHCANASSKLHTAKIQAGFFHLPGM